MNQSKLTAQAALTEAQRRRFVVDGFVKVEHASPRKVADAARAIFWA